MSLQQVAVAAPDPSGTGTTLVPTLVSTTDSTLVPTPVPTPAPTPAPPADDELHGGIIDPDTDLLIFKIFSNAETLKELLKENHFDRGHLVLWKAKLESDYKLYLQSKVQNKKIDGKYATKVALKKVQDLATQAKEDADDAKRKATTATVQADDARKRVITIEATRNVTDSSQRVTTQTVTIQELIAWRNKVLAVRQLNEFIDLSNQYLSPTNKPRYVQRYEEVLAGIRDIVKIAVPDVNEQSRYLVRRDKVLAEYKLIRKNSIVGNRRTLRRWSDKLRGNRSFFGGIKTKRGRKRKQTKRVTPLIAN